MGNLDSGSVMAFSTRRRSFMVARGAVCFGMMPSDVREAGIAPGGGGEIKPEDRQA